MKVKLGEFLPFLALGVIALALYLAYTSVQKAGPYLTQQPSIMLNPTSWVTVPPGLANTVYITPAGGGAPVKVQAEPYYGGGGPWANWKA